MNNLERDLFLTLAFVPKREVAPGEGWGGYIKDFDVAECYITAVCGIFATTEINEQAKEGCPPGMIPAWCNVWPDGHVGVRFFVP